MLGYMGAWHSVIVIDYQLLSLVTSDNIDYVLFGARVWQVRCSYMFYVEHFEISRNA